MRGISKLPVVQISARLFSVLRKKPRRKELRTIFANPIIFRGAQNRDVFVYNKMELGKERIEQGGEGAADPPRVPGAFANTPVGQGVDLWTLTSSLEKAYSQSRAPATSNLDCRGSPRMSRWPQPCSSTCHPYTLSDALFDLRGFRKP